MALDCSTQVCGLVSPWPHDLPPLLGYLQGKGRIVIDSSSKLGKDGKGNMNPQIPKQGIEGQAEECPPVYYGRAMMPHALTSRPFGESFMTLT